MSEEMKEYTVFTTTTKDGKEVEMAAVDEFQFEHKNYIVAAQIINDEVNEDAGLYIYRARVGKDDFYIEKIEDKEEYQKAGVAYMEFCAEHMDDEETQPETGKKGN